jgi:hypothetical protein
MGEALAARFEEQRQAAEGSRREVPAAFDMNADVRELADKVAAEPELLNVLDEKRRQRVEHYNAWRKIRDNRTDDTGPNGDAA